MALDKTEVKWAVESAVETALDDFDWPEDDSVGNDSEKLLDDFCQVVLDTARGNGPSDPRARRLLEDLRAL